MKPLLAILAIAMLSVTVIAGESVRTRTIDVDSHQQSVLIPQATTETITRTRMVPEVYTETEEYDVTVMVPSTERRTRDVQRTRYVPQVTTETVDIVQQAIPQERYYYDDDDDIDINIDIDDGNGADDIDIDIDIDDDNDGRRRLDLRRRILGRILRNRFSMLIADRVGTRNTDDRVSIGISIDD